MNPAEAGPIIEAMDEKMKAPAVADSLKYARLDPKRAIDSREAIEAFYNELLKTANPESIGGKLPDDGFYYQP
jgi:NitT/TauT family transport system substrate-binding protein